MYQFVEVTNGWKYRFRVAMRLSDPQPLDADRGIVVITYYNDHGSTDPIKWEFLGAVQESGPSYVSRLGWSIWEMDSEAPAGSTDARVTLRTISDTNGGHIYWDDASFYATGP